uniref:Uncharacterized protein n=1 Tax=Kalanchoe fedtschenkoi TaxID=63787 RepID=A0A7N0UJ91_KALFE
MAAPRFGLAYKPSFSPSSPFLNFLRKTRPCVLASPDKADEPPDISRQLNFKELGSSKRRAVGGEAGNGNVKWKRISSKDLGVSTSSIAQPIRVVLNGLKRKGHKVYLVGGCVRDLVLKRTPKDFDIITTAELKEVLKTFSHSHIVGKRFPICHVHVNDSIIEVSSFCTSAKKFNEFPDHYEKPLDSEKEDNLRWRNCLQRDFTINGLMFDPYKKLIYDYTGGIDDIKKAKVRTVTHSNISFQEDCARILRGIRIAARLGFGLSKETAQSVRNLSTSVLKLDKGRLLMEMNYMLAYGSAEASLRLLWKFGLLDFLLPIQAAYLVRKGFRRRDKGSNMLLSLLANMDKLLAPDKPCHSSLWVGILAFHMALSKRPRDPLVVSTFCLAVYNGGNLPEAANIAKSITRPHNDSFEELLDPGCVDLQSLIEEVMDFAESVNHALSKMTDGQYVSQAMARYPEAPKSDLVFIHLHLYLRTCRIFECVEGGKEKGFVPKHGNEIDYEPLAAGSLQELRNIFARIVFDTVYPLLLLQNP